jgi:hypothetical protein
MPGQLGPTMRVLFCVLSMSVIRTMSAIVSSWLYLVACSHIPCCGIPSVMLQAV